MQQDSTSQFHVISVVYKHPSVSSVRITQGLISVRYSLSAFVISSALWACFDISDQPVSNTTEDMRSHFQDQPRFEPVGRFSFPFFSFFVLGATQSGRIRHPGFASTGLACLHNPARQPGPGSNFPSDFTPEHNNIIMSLPQAHPATLLLRVGDTGFDFS